MKLSIVTVTWNDITGLQQTFLSLECQTNQSFEWVVVDGGSTDGTPAWLAEISSKPLPFAIRYVSAKDNGIYDGMNKGVRLATGDHLWFLNGGDVIASPSIINDVATLPFAENRIIYGGYAMRFGAKAFLHRPPRSPNYLRHSLPTSHQAILYPRLFCLQNPYPNRYRVCGDYYLTCRAYAAHMEFLVCDVELAVFDIGGTSFQAQRRLLSEATAIQSEVLELGMFLRTLSSTRRRFSLMLTRVLHRKPGLVAAGPPSRTRPYRIWQWKQGGYR
jgi:putative colanic acid biosynthesis glycosyltransferase